MKAQQEDVARRRYDVMLDNARKARKYFSRLTPTDDNINNRTIVSQYKQQLAALRDDLKVRIPVSFDEKNEIDKLYTRIQLMEKALEVEIPVDFKLKKTALARLGAEMSLIEKMMGGVTKRVEKDFSNLRSALPKFGTGLNPAAYATIMLGIAAVAAPLIGLITAALLAIPGVLATVMAPIGAMLLGFRGRQKGH